MEDKLNIKNYLKCDNENTLDDILELMLILKLVRQKK